MRTLTLRSFSWIALLTLAVGCQLLVDPRKHHDAGGGIPCGQITCAADETCCSPSCGICEPKGGACPAIACADEDASVTPPSTCAATTCPTGTYCDDISGSAVCEQLPSCDSVQCAAGTTCELVDVECIRAPCPPQPQCVPNPVQACNLLCRVGSHCEVGSNGPTCVPDSNGVSCGKTTCASGQVCCSASCGICGPAGGLCPAIACAANN